MGRQIAKNRECTHATCGETCRREKKEKKVYRLKRTAIKKKPGYRIKKKPGYRIPKVSDTQAKLLEIYKPLAAEFCINNPTCQLKLPGCTYWTSGVQHTKGKVGKDTDGTPMMIAVRFWKAACNCCNGRAEQKPIEARETGAAVSRLAKEVN